MTSQPTLSRGSAQLLADGEGQPSGHSRPSWLLPVCAGAALLVMLVALALGGGRPQRAVAGLADAGPATGWALPVVRLAFDLAAVATVGALLAAVALLRPPPVLLDTSLRAVRAAGWSAALWSATALLLLVLTTSESLGVPVGELTGTDLDGQAARSSGRALLVVAGLGLLLAVGSRVVRTSTGGWWLLVASVSALLPTTLTGHAASASDHQLAVSSLVVHVVTATLWVGGLLGVLLFLRGAAQLVPAVQRFSALALTCFVLVALSGALSAWERLGFSPAAWTSGYGAVVLAKTAALAVLGVMGWRHRQRLLPSLAAGRPGAFLSFAAVEVAVMAGALGLAVALSRTPTPAAAPESTTVAAHGSGHAALPTEVAPVSASRLLLEWRIDAIVLTVLGLAAVAYLTGVRRVRADGESWPARRTAAFLSGLVVALLALSSGIATYAAAMISVQLAQFFLLVLVVPALLLLGSPLTLLLRRRAQTASPGGPEEVPRVLRSRAAQVLTDPLAAMAAVSGLVFAVYRTGLLEVALRRPEVLLLLDAAAISAGLLLLWPALGRDPLPQVRGRLERVSPLLVTAASLGVLAAQLVADDQLVAQRWFTDLGWSWVEPAADQRLGGLLVTAAVALLLALALPAWRAQPPVLPGEPDA